MTDISRHSAPDVIALFVACPSARWPGIIGSEMWYIWHDGWPETREKIEREHVTCRVACAMMVARGTKSLSRQTRFWEISVKRTTDSGDYYDSRRLYRASTREIYRRGRRKACKLTIVEAAVGQSEPLSRWIVIIALASGDADRCRL